MLLIKAVGALAVILGLVGQVDLPEILNIGDYIAAAVQFILSGITSVLAAILAFRLVREQLDWAGWIVGETPHLMEIDAAQEARAKLEDKYGSGIIAALDSGEYFGMAGGMPVLDRDDAEAAVAAGLTVDLADGSTWEPGEKEVRD